MLSEKKIPPKSKRLCASYSRFNPKNDLKICF
jgi:hypothetical protein